MTDRWTRYELGRSHLTILSASCLDHRGSRSEVPVSCRDSCPEPQLSLRRRLENDFWEDSGRQVSLPGELDKPEEVGPHNYPETKFGSGARLGRGDGVPTRRLVHTLDECAPRKHPSKFASAPSVF